MLVGFVVGATVAAVSVAYIIYKDVKRYPWGSTPKVEQESD